MLTADRTTTTDYQPPERRGRAGDILTAPITFRVALSVVGALAAIVAAAYTAGAATNAVRLNAKLDETRFVADSARRDGERDVDHAILLRLDARVGAMYCDGKPPGCQ